MIYAFLSYITGLRLGRSYTTNFGQQSGRMGVILSSTTLHIQTAVKAINYTGGKNPSNLSFLQKHAHGFAGRVPSTPGLEILCQCPVLAVSRALILGLL